MDKKKRIKTIAALCFVVLCGGIYLGIRAGAQEGDDAFLLEKRADVWQTPGAEAAGITPVTERVETTPEPDEMPEAVGTLFVHICGAVAKEGVYEVPEGSRVTDGIVAAGGFCESADTTYHNLATPLRDGQRIYVPTREETTGCTVEERLDGSKETGMTGEAVPEAGDSRVNINTAGLAELMTLSGIGESKAAGILQYREKVGLFQSIEELKNVSGIGEAMFARIKDSIRIE